MSKQNSNLKVEQIEKMDFSAIVGITNEPNTPSGAAQTIRRIIQQIPFYSHYRILDVGCNTGYASIEIASWIDAKVFGVDINQTSLEFAKAKGKRFSNLSFCRVNALNLPFADSSFNLVYVNNVTSFISDRKGAIFEYYRVLQPLGVLAVVPIFYHIPPPLSLHKKVEEAVGANIPIRGKNYWYECFNSADAELFFDEEYEYIYQTPERIDWYVKFVMSQPHLSEFSGQIKNALSARLTYFYQLFNENLRFAKYCILLYRYLPANLTPILFETQKVV